MMKQDQRLIILLGEGNFSFAALLAEKISLSKDFIIRNTFLIATDLVLDRQNRISTKLNSTIQANIDYLIGSGFSVWLDLDCTKLEQHCQLIETLENVGNNSVVIFVFNFPHAHNVKMKIDLNRSLLANTFRSLQKLLSKFPRIRSGARVCITLCYGQSGLNELEPPGRHRSWSDSWQITEMCAAGNFGLIEAVPFGSQFIDKIIAEEIAKEKNEKNSKTIFESDFPQNQLSYQAFGYRLQDKPFNQAIGDEKIKKNYRFQGGNVFIFEHRDDILDWLDRRYSRICDEKRRNCKVNSDLAPQPDSDPDLNSELRNSIFSTTKLLLLHAQTYNRDFTIRIDRTKKVSNLAIENESFDYDDIEKRFRFAAYRILGRSLLQSSPPQLKNRYIVSRTIVSYCFALRICSRDFPLNRQKLIQIMDRFQARIFDFFPEAVNASPPPLLPSK